MASQRAFNYDEFLVKFRTACAQHGIDPVEGATSYQVVHLVVDQRRARWNPNLNRWWRRSGLWGGCPPYHSPTEQAVIWHLYRITYRMERRRWLRRKLREAVEVT